MPRSEQEIMAELSGLLGGGQPQQQSTIQIPQSVPNQMIPKSMNVGGMTYENPASAAILKNAGQDTPQDVKDKKVAELSGNAEPLVKSAVNALKVNVAALKNLESKGSIGRIAGAVGTVKGMVGADSDVRPYDALLDSTAWELAKIANPSGRPTEDAKNDWKRTLGGRWDNVAEASKKLQHGILLALGRGAAYDPKSNFDPNSPEITDTVNSILNTKALAEPTQVADHSNLIPPELANQAAAILASRRKSNGSK